ncbi:hypothetical protein D3C80_2227430 [compost metagenome]
MLRRVRSSSSMRSSKSVASRPLGFSSTASAPAARARMAVVESRTLALAVSTTTGKA